MSGKQKSTNLVWIDLEMTGLDPRKHTILEIGTVVTDNDLNIVSEGPYLIVHHSPKVLGSMEAWSKRTHRRSGLTEAAANSRVSMKTAEEETLCFIKAHCALKTAPLCGNTIWQDRRFLVKYMPRLESYLHYRTIDVSSVKELVGRWYSGKHRMPRLKNQLHRVADDIRESIEELRYYRQKVFVPS